MREILFRGKNINTNDWVFGSLVYSAKEKQYYIVEQQDNELSFPVYEESISQYTDLTDKNGKYIFEGDIIKTYHGLGKVVYSKQFAVFGYIMIEKNNHEKEYDYRFTEVVIEDGIEVIGNIYDNPELLEVE